MDPRIKYPFVTEELITALEEDFPNHCPRLDYEDRRIWYEAGQFSVVEFLRCIHEEQHGGSAD